MKLVNEDTFSEAPDLAISFVSVRKCSLLLANVAALQQQSLSVLAHIISLCL